jgi:molybdopterin synthase sulfur carrier subunit
VLIKYFATFRDLTGENSFQLVESPARIADLLELLSVRYGNGFRKAVFDDGALSALLILLVNGRNVRLTGGLSTPLSATDEVSVFPMVAGG